MSKFTDADLKRWKSEINAGLVIGSRITLRREGREYVACCPFHKDDTPSFKVYLLDDGTWGYKCFGCGANGNVFQFIEKFDKIKFIQAVDKVLELAGVTGWESGKVQVDKTFGALASQKEYVTFRYEDYKQAEDELEKSPEGQKWLADRGITMETARRFHLGFVQSVAALTSKDHPWLEKGWVLFPTFNSGGVVTAVKYRSTVGKKLVVGEGDHQQRWSGILRAKDTSTTLYNLQEVNPFDDVYITEGEPDTLILSQAGLVAVAYPSGEYTPTSSERDALMKAPRRFCAGDMDDTGHKAMDKLWGELRDNTYRLEWPNNCKDANETFLKECNGDQEKFAVLLDQLKQKALAQPVRDYYDMAESMEVQEGENPMDNPRRLHFKSPDVDGMAISVPGDVVSVFASYTGSGKTTWIIDQIILPEVINHCSIVINYSAELSIAELSVLIAANLTGQDRLKIRRDHLQDAAQTLRDAHAQFYVGYNPDLDRIGKVLDSLEWAIRRFGANIVVLDHLHFLCRGEKDDIKAQADAMQRIKNIARKYGVIFIVVGQSRKPAQGTKGKSSEQWDAKGSETFTSDATATYHIHRARKSDIDWDHPETWPADILENKTEIRLDKCRTKGSGKAVALQTFCGAIAQFRDYTLQSPDAPPMTEPPPTAPPTTFPEFAENEVDLGAIDVNK